MKQILLIFSMLFMLVVQATRAQAPEGSTLTNDVIKVSDLMDVGDGLYCFAVSIEGEKEGQNYVNYQMDIVLPNGISYYYEESEGVKSYWVAFSEDEDFYPYTKVMNKKTFSHTFEFSLLEANKLRVACYAADNKPFKQKDGELFYVYVTVDESVFNNSYSPKPFVRVETVRIADTEANDYHIDDFTCRPFSTGIPAERELKLFVNAGNKVGTLILPFSTALPEGVRAYTCSEIDTEEEGLLSLTEVSELKACTPYIIYASKGVDCELTGSVDMAVNYPLDDVYTEGLLSGVLKTTVVNTGYIMQNQGDGPAFYNAECSSFSLNPGKCYLSPSETLSAKAYSFNFDGATGISEVTSDTKVADGITYDLTGRPVTNPSRGIYIRNGKKIVVGK